ncbi:MAG: hypothetical protein EBS42_16350 [Caulobacteraceae bacterium]|nr:hypothetical protein [Caulobacteraceae bacterium]
MRQHVFVVIVAALMLAACAATPSGLPDGGPAPRPADSHFDRLQSLCGKRFAGQVTSTDPLDAAFAGKPLVMGVVACSASEVRIPFAVGPDQSRTWIITRTPAGLRLKHDHRHSDGTEDVLSRYGGDSLEPGAAERQEFPADAFSRTLFLEKGNPASVTNVWATKLRPGQSFAYELRRPGRFFRVEFDLTKAL